MKRIEPWFAAYLKAQFAVSFVRHDDSFTTRGQRFANRIAVSEGWDANAPAAALRQGLAALAAPAVAVAS